MGREEEFLLPFLVGLFVVFEDTSGKPYRYIYSGFNLEIMGDWIYVTAGHCLDNIQEAIDQDDLELRAARLVDCVQLESPSQTPLPIALPNNLLTAFEKDDYGDGVRCDCGVLPMHGMFRDGMISNGIKAFPIQFCFRIQKHDTIFDRVFILGFPDFEKELYMDNGMFSSPPWVVPVDNLRIKSSLMLEGEIKGSVKDIKGMSGGPVLGIIRDDEEGDLLVPLGIQSSIRGNTVLIHRIDNVASVLVSRYVERHGYEPE